MEKTPDVILQAIDIHSTLSMCKFCPYGPVPDCELILLQDAAELIRKLQCEQTVHAVWIHCKGSSHLYYCSACGEKILYNPKPSTYKIPKKPVWEVNARCRKCGAFMGRQGGVKL